MSTFMGRSEVRIGKTTLLSADKTPRAERVYVAPLTRGEKVGRNAPCPCGSGQKFKRCCGGRP